MRVLSLCRVLPVVVFSGVLAFAVTGCGTKVTRTSAEAVTDLSGNWNDTDSRLVSEEMIQDVLSRNWLSRFTRKHGKPPTVIVGTIRNLSHEHINTRTFINDLEKDLINSGEVEFVASADERGEIREERREQDLHSREDTRKAMGQEIGADFMLKGSINTIVDAVKGEQARFYQIDLTLIDLESNRKVWVGQKKIKKTIEKGGLRL
ncbi:MAG: penicillin-binding protein activator LpoB [Gammaproteobacteria bacterium]|nr:penicillin-binding protein activator LpoB [Gammaproteobacteria bacterium]MCW8910764.1 penicillin-binding protein activator LpoB [Gammaproteobacteria bacterium]MCW9005500.1 penicillin-binding protein activator LpoB [Gammaproteobacteria bacterium]